MDINEPDNKPDAGDWPLPPFGHLNSPLAQAASLARLQYRWRVRGLSWGGAAGALIPCLIDMYCNSTIRPFHIACPDIALAFIGLIGGALVGCTIASLLLAFAQGEAVKMGRYE